MITPFDLVQALRSWFFARDGDVVLQSGRKIAVDSANIEISGGNLTITTGNITITGTVDGIDISAHAADGDAHHNQSHVLATGSALGPDHTISGASAGQVLRASGSTSARFDPLGHGDLSGVTADQHHNESHTVASHSDTTATGSELNTLTDGSDASSLHDHDGRYFQESEFDSDPGSSSAPLETDANGRIRVRGLAVGTTAVASNDNIAVNGDVSIGDDLQAGGGIVSGDSSGNPPTGTLYLKEVSAPGTPPSGFGVLYVSTTGFIHFKNDAGTDWTLSDV